MRMLRRRKYKLGHGTTRMRPIPGKGPSQTDAVRSYLHPEGNCMFPPKRNKRTERDNQISQEKAVSQSFEALEVIFPAKPATS